MGEIFSKSYFASNHGEETVFWRIENFSLFCSHDAFKTPNFSVINDYFLCYLTLDVLHPGERLRLALHNRCDCRDSSSSCSFDFYSQIGNAPYTMFHSGGRIGSQLENGIGLYEIHSSVLDSLSRSPDDSLTFRVNFSHGRYSNPYLNKRFCFTHISETEVTFAWEIKNFSVGESGTSIPSQCLSFLINRHPDSEENVIEVDVTYEKAERISIPCVVYFIEESERLAHIAHFAVSSGGLDPGSYPKGSFAISKEFYESNVRRCVEIGGKLTLVFQLRIRNGRQKYSKGFDYKPFVEACENTDKSFYKSSSSFPVSREEAMVTEGTLHGDQIGDKNGEEAVCETVQTQDSSVDLDILCGLRSLYFEPVFSDFTLRAGGRSFPVHRNILSARSVVFRAMFEADMQEKKENCSEVTDVDADTLDRMLRFIYSDDFADPDVESAAKLYAAADKYQIGALRARCVQSFSVRGDCLPGSDPGGPAPRPSSEAESHGVCSEQRKEGFLHSRMEAADGR